MKLVPHLQVIGAPRAIDWYKQVFDAREIARYVDKRQDKIVHADLVIGESPISIREGDAKYGVITLHVDDAFAVGERMTAAGAKVIYPIADQFYGDRQGRLEDPFGQQWVVTQRLREMSPEEIQQGVDDWKPDA
ncbi:MAG TPA: glyoxalase/bleomycin resistance/extradiol dioxygenase family protein [Kofleriaceae bacterium]|nr:glyoxalase/bleomycin resistance/extradiol dioxygenase family protein [Kofleriaceae bacterium]